MTVPSVDVLCYLGSDSSSANQIGGSIFDGLVTPVVKSDLEIARGVSS
jgi:hypothetical protein